MDHVVRLADEIVHRYIFELRYESGHLWWDRAGRIAREIAAAEGWDVEGIDERGCHAALREKNLSFTFAPGKLDLSQTQSLDVVDLLPVAEFAAIADTFTRLVADVLDLSSYPRIGFRVWTLYAASDRDESHRMVRRLRLFRTEAELERSLGQISETSCRIVVERPSHMVRIAVAPFEQAVEIPASVVQAARVRARDLWRDQRRALLDKLRAQKIVKSYPQFGLLLDLDAYVEEPPFPNQLSVTDFITTAASDFETLKQVVLTA